MIAIASQHLLLLRVPALTTSCPGHTNAGRLLFNTLNQVPLSTRPRCSPSFDTQSGTSSGIYSFSVCPLPMSAAYLCPALRSSSQDISVTTS
jgi:hypothetical protein